MTEADHSLAEALRQEPKVFDLSDPKTRREVLRRIEAESLSPGDKIIGMKTWADVSTIIDSLIVKILATAEPDHAIERNLKNDPDIENVFRQRDKEKGFWGTSKGFEITMLKTDISFMGRTRRLCPTDPALARTFMISREILHRQRVSAACTLSLYDAGVSSKPNETTHYFSGIICAEDREGKALDAIDRSRKSPASFASSTYKRTGFGIKNPNTP